MLTEHSLKKAEELGYNAVLVIGHPKYYPKLGFKEAKFFNILPPLEGIPSEAFMILVLKPEGLEKIKGKVIFPKEYYENM
jgi:predicted N-acetyltransferase YhbS